MLNCVIKFYFLWNFNCHYKCTLTFVRRYNEVNNNCFDYVISVLNAADKNSNQKLTKLQLTQEFISPAINKTVRLLSIVRNVLEDGFFLQGNITESLIS